MTCLEYRSAHAPMAGSQRFRKSEISLDTGTDTYRKRKIQYTSVFFKIHPNCGALAMLCRVSTLRCRPARANILSRQILGEIVRRRAVVAGGREPSACHCRNGNERQEQQVAFGFHHHTHPDRGASSRALGQRRKRAAVFVAVERLEGFARV